MILKYLINAREVLQYFIPTRKVLPCLGVTGTAEGGTAIFHCCERITAIFRSTENRRNNRYSQKVKYREPAKKYHQVEILHRMCPPKKTVPRNTPKIIEMWELTSIARIEGTIQAKELCNPRVEAVE